MAFSTVGKVKATAHVLVLVLNLVVLVLSTRVNLFQDFFFVADKFPFILSIVTAIVLGSMTLLDLVSSTAFTGRPQFEVGVFAVLGIFWLAFNAFSTSRWRMVPTDCSVIPSAFPDDIRWCHELGALRAFVWLEWVIMTITCLATLRYSVTQNTRGHKHIFKMPFSRYSPTIVMHPSFNYYAQDSRYQFKA